jgi:hypothetical protein
MSAARRRELEKAKVVLSCRIKGKKAGHKKAALAFAQIRLARRLALPPLKPQF